MMQHLPKYLRLLASPNKMLMPKRYLFTVSHMRARTTLLSHILASNNEICGHNELHISYRSVLDKFRLRAALQSEYNYQAASYLHDKMLHNKLVLNEDIFSQGLKVILIVREPVGTLNSMAKMHKKVWGNDNYHHLEDYYCARLDWLTEHFAQYQNDIFFINSDDFVTNSATVLQQLSEYLQLKEPLSSDYKVFEDTGVAGKGDPSQHIQSGGIIATGSSDKKAFEFSYDKAEKSFKQCVAQLATT